MEERRKHKRLGLEGSLLAKRLNGSEAGEIAINIMDVSKTGVGFFCEEPLQIGTVYEVQLTIWTKEVIHTFIEIVRIEKKENGYLYGAIFIGMPEIDAQRIAIYETFEENK